MRASLQEPTISIPSVMTTFGKTFQKKRFYENGPGVHNVASHLFSLIFIHGKMRGRRSCRTRLKVDKREDDRYSRMN